MNLLRKYRRAIVFFYDLGIIAISYYLSFALRFDFKIPADQMANLTRGFPWILGIQSAVFVSQSLYRGMWSYASLRDLALIVRSAVIAASLSVVFLTFYDRFTGWPRSVFVLDGFLLVMLLGSGRFIYRFFRENGWALGRTGRKTLIIGAGLTGDFVAREIQHRKEISADVIGFLDDDLLKKGSSLHGAQVLGTLSDIQKVLAKKVIDDVIIAIPSLPGQQLKPILEAAQEKKIQVRIAPPIQDVLNGKVSLNQMREVRVEDLLRRDVVDIDEDSIRSFFAGKRVLVTGAGGSIGSELCRQIIRTGPSHVVLFERTEFNLFRFMNEIQRERLGSQGTQICPVMADILDTRRLEQVFADFRPQIVVHAAAYKHVPLLEENPYEAIQNNVLGSYLVAKTASRFGVETFLLVSTDKAVRPTNILGASKRMAERVVNEVGKSSKTMKTVSVRFGNVLDSEGSVLPKFRDQIASGGPVTITDPEVTRYFMTIPEASSLVLQSCVLGQGSEIFLLDMGKPVKILELAEDLIRLSGLKPGQDIEIQFTGLRPGEKLYEELLIDEKGHEKTAHPKIFKGSRDLTEALDGDWEKRIVSFAESGELLPLAQIKEWICQWVPEYGPPAHSSKSATAQTIDDEERGFLH